MPKVLSLTQSMVIYLLSCHLFLLQVEPSGRPPAEVAGFQQRRTQIHHLELGTELGEVRSWRCVVVYIIMQVRFIVE